MHAKDGPCQGTYLTYSSHFDHKQSFTTKWPYYDTIALHNFNKFMTFDKSTSRFRLQTNDGRLLNIGKCIVVEGSSRWAGRCDRRFAKEC